mgnify:CR=1 FL=1
MKKDYWDKYITELMIEMGSDDWPVEETQTIRSQIEETLQTKLMAVLIDHLTVSQRLTLKTILQQDKTPLSIINYLYSAKPDVIKIIEKCLVDFRTEVLS